MLPFLNAMLGHQTKPQNDTDERLFRAAIDLAPVAMAVTDATQPDHPVLYVNRQFCAITGYAPDEVLGRNLRLLQGTATDPAAKAALRQALAENRPVMAELLNYRKDGGPFWMKLQITPVADAAGQVVRHLGTMEDVTEAHRMAELPREREERLQAVTGAIPLPMIIIDFAGRIIEANTYAQSGCGDGFGPGRLLGDFVEFAPLLERLQSQRGVHQMEIRRPTEDGRVRWLLASAVPFSMAKKDVAIVVFVDIDRQKRKEAELARARDDAERAIRAKSRFFAAASHDLRQPLQALALFATALEPHLKTPVGQTILSSIKQSLSTMEDMFETLLDMSRLDAGVLTAQPEVFMVKDLLERLEVEFAPQADSKALALRVVPTSAAVKSDPALLGRILRNFLSNAVRYTPSGKILVGCKRRGGKLALIVADTGPGIPEDQRLAIFEEFFQGADRGSSSGLGLGLAIVQRLARLLGHRLDVRSRPGCGALFSVEVPLAEAPLPSRDDDAETDPPGDLSGSTVLVIDDDQSVREGLSMLIEDWGARIVVAESSNEALDKLRIAGASPDVVLADLRLPEAGGGMGAISHLDGVLQREVPCFLFTGDTDTRGAQTGQGGRHLRVLHKPINARKLRAVLAEAMGR